jgi:hypothetical protein
MTIRIDSRVVLAKIESSYGTDSVPTNTANAVRLMNVKESLFEGDAVETEELGLGMGSNPKDLVGRYGVIEFDVELQSSGTLGTAPAMGPILRACGLAETISAGVSVAYTPVSASFEAVSFYYFSGNNKAAFVGGRGDAQLVYERNKKAKAHFKLWGLFSSQGNASQPTPTLTAWKRALYCTKANTTYSVDSAAVVANTLTFSLGNQCKYLERMGRQEITIDDRKPAFQTTIEDVNISTKDWRGLVNSSTSAALSHQLGATDGSIVLLTAGACQLQPLADDKDGVDTMLNMNWNVLRGSPDFTLTFK